MSSEPMKVKEIKIGDRTVYELEAIDGEEDIDKMTRHLANKKKLEDGLFSDAKNDLLEKAKGNVSAGMLQKIEAIDSLVQLETYRDFMDELKFDDGNLHEEGDPNNPPGGSQVDLNPPNRGGGKITEFKDYREMIDHLYDTQDTDERSKWDLRKLWDKASKKLREEGGVSMTIMGCPRCGRGLLKGENDNICSNCGWDSNKFASKGGDIF